MNRKIFGIVIHLFIALYTFGIKKCVFAVTKRILNHAKALSLPFNVVLVLFCTLHLLVVSLISVMLDCCKDDH